MTKREPFAVVAEYSLCQQVILSVGGYAVCSTNDKERAFLDAARINDAYEARVKEECEKVRIETVLLCAEKADRMGSEDIRNAIMFETVRK